MTVTELTKKLNAAVYAMPDGGREILGGYAGDFLSFVMGKAPEGSAWFTVMTNVNVAAVATLADVAVIVICEDCHPDTKLVEKAEENGINVIGTSLDIFYAARLM